MKTGPLPDNFKPPGLKPGQRLLEYQLVTSYEPSELERTVNSLLRQGFNLKGRLKLVVVPGHRPLYLREMTRGVEV